jgi:hypothetical protein
MPTTEAAETIDPVDEQIEAIVAWARGTSDAPRGLWSLAAEDLRAECRELIARAREGWEPMPTTEIYADTRGPARCRGCNAEIVFAENVKTGRRMPYDAPLVALRTRHDESMRMIEEVDLKDSHFATCPDAKRFRR